MLPANGLRLPLGHPSFHPIYAEADITVDSRDVAHTSIVNTIIKTLARWPGWDRLKNEQD